MRYEIAISPLVISIFLDLKEEFEAYILCFVSVKLWGLVAVLLQRVYRFLDLLKTLKNIPLDYVKLSHVSKYLYGSIQRFCKHGVISRAICCTSDSLQEKVYIQHIFFQNRIAYSSSWILCSLYLRLTCDFNPPSKASKLYIKGCIKYQTLPSNQYLQIVL